MTHPHPYSHQEQEQDFVQRIAVSWYWRLQDPDVPAEERQQFRVWIAIDEHRKAFDRAATVWEDTCQASLADAANVAAPPATHRRLTRVLVRTAVGLLLLTAFGSPPGTAAWILEAGKTTTAHRLFDGSFVRVAPDTRLEISFDQRERASYLPRGRAFFDVSKDTKRPFIVRTPAAMVRATGTHFGVTYQQETSVITVKEGSVIVSYIDAFVPGASEPVTRRWFLQPGQQLRVSQWGADLGVQVEADGSLDWATTIRFERDPLGVAVERWNRLSDVRLELLDPSVTGAAITGTYQFDDPKAFAKRIANETSSPVRLYERAAGGRAALPETVQPDDADSTDPRPNQNRNREAAP